MKKIYLTMLGLGLAVQTINAQLTLLQTFHEPVPGMPSQQAYDSVGVVPKSAGTNMMWDFSNFVQKTTVDTRTFVTASSVASASMFPGATLAEDFGGSFGFYKSSTGPDKLEALGEYESTTSSKTMYTDLLTMYSWPMAYNSTYSDTYAATMSGGFIVGNMSGVLNVSAPGAGSLTLPGGLMLSNVLQVKAVQTLTMNITSPTNTTIAGTLTSYNYYHSSQRYPVVTVAYDNFGSTATTGEVMINKLLAVGITDYNLDADFSIYPNPAKTNFYVNFQNVKQENCQLEISNISGQLVKTIDLGNNSNISTDIDITTLESGIYFVKTNLGSVQSTRKLIVE